MLLQIWVEQNDIKWRSICCHLHGIASPNHLKPAHELHTFLHSAPPKLSSFELLLVHHCDDYITRWDFLEMRPQVGLNSHKTYLKTILYVYIYVCVCIIYYIYIYIYICDYICRHFLCSQLNQPVALSGYRGSSQLLPTFQQCKDAMDARGQPFHLTVAETLPQRYVAFVHAKMTI